MANQHDLNETFNACIEAIDQGQTTLEECIARYPDVVGLEDLLRTVSAVDRLSALKMPAAQKDAIAQQLAQQITLRVNQRMSTPRPVGRPPMRVSVTFALAACLLVIFFAGLLYIAGRNGRDNAAKPGATSTVQPTPTGTKPAVTIDTIKQKTQDCLINPRFYNSFRAKLAVNQLRAFVNEVRAQRGKKLDADCADELIDMATELMNGSR